MNYNQDKIDLLIALIDGSLKGKQKKILLDEIKNDPELSETYYLLQKMHQITPENSNSIISATKKLSNVLFQDYLKEQASSKFSFGVQIFDSSLLPLPEGIRPAMVDTRLLKYQVGDSLVELTIYPITIDSVEIIGQIDKLEKDHKITITALSNKKSQDVEVDEFGLFRFDRIDVGKCSLKFSIEKSKEGIIELDL